MVFKYYITVLVQVLVTINTPTKFLFLVFANELSFFLRVKAISVELNETVSGVSCTSGNSANSAPLSNTISVQII